MEQSTKLIIAAVGLGGLGYFLYKKGLFGSKAQTTLATTPVVTPVVTPVLPKVTPPPPPPVNTVVVAPATTKTYIYPAGLQEGDYVKFGTEATVYLLHNGKKLPITKEWWDVNAWDKWGSVKMNPPADGLDIPTGNTL